MSAIFGDERFKQWVFDDLLPQLAAENKSRIIAPNITMLNIINFVAQTYQIAVDTIINRINGRQSENEPRKIAMYLCQELTSAHLVDMAEQFNLKNPSSISTITHQVRVKKKAEQTFKNKIDNMIRNLLKTDN